MAAKKNIIAQDVDQTPAAALDRIDTMDLVTRRHHQVVAILESLSMSFDSTQSEPTGRTVKNAIWAVQDLLEESRDTAIRYMSTVGATA